jgi:AcrR family transcriptional regulator
VPAEERKRKRVRPGGHKLRREVLEHHQRQRILSGAAEAIAERGYRQTSVADIVRSAAIARASFYENFSSKEDCFFSLYDESSAAALDLVAGACRAAGENDFSVRVRVGLEVLLDHLGAEPVLARAIIVEGPAVGPPITSRFESLIGNFAALLRAGRPGSTEVELPETVEETVVGGLYWLLYYAVLDRRPKRIERLLPQLTEFSLIPYLGAEAARRAASARS